MVTAAVFVLFWWLFDGLWRPVRGRVRDFVVLAGIGLAGAVGGGAAKGLESAIGATLAKYGLDSAATRYLGMGLAGLVVRMDAGRFATRDILAVLVAGLRGGGWTGTEADLMTRQIEGGPLQAARLAAQLLALAFRAPA